VHIASALDYQSQGELLSQTPNALGGTTSTYLVPTKDLPLTEPLRRLGFPAKFVDKLDSILKPIVDAGYSRLTPDRGPHFAGGRLVLGQGTAPARAAVQKTDAPRSAGPRGSRS